MVEARPAVPHCTRIELANRTRCSADEPVSAAVLPQKGSCRANATRARNGVGLCPDQLPRVAASSRPTPPVRADITPATDYLVGYSAASLPHYPTMAQTAMQARMTLKHALANGEKGMGFWLT